MFLGLLSLLAGLGDVAFAVGMVGMLGVPWALTMSIPYAIVSTLAPAQDRGKLFGALNVFVVIPELVLLAAVAVVPLDSRRIMGAGAAVALAAAFTSTAITIHPDVSTAKGRNQTQSQRESGVDDIASARKKGPREAGMV